MKQILCILMSVAIGFTVSPQTDGEINDLINLLNQQAAGSMNIEIERIQTELQKARTLNDRLKNRLSISGTTAMQGNNQLEVFLSGFSDFDELFVKNADGNHVRGNVMEVIKKSDDSELRQAYLEAFDMNESLNVAYDEETNDRFIKDADNVKPRLLPAHQPGFDKLVSLISDYNFYMYELARLFTAADKNKYVKSAGQLAKDEFASYLMDVPYTARMLQTYIENKGQLEDKEELKKSCPDAFPNL